MKRASLGAVLVTASVLAPAFAAEQVGRTKFELPEGWTPVTRYDSKMIFNAGEYSLPLRHALYQLPGGGKVPRALLLVTATDGGNRENVSWITDICPAPNRNFYTHDYGGAAVKSHRDCLVVNGSFAPAKFFKPEGEVVTAMQAAGLEFPKAMASVRSTVALRGGTYLQLNFMPQRDFAGLPDEVPAAADLHEVPPALVAWGEALRLAASRSVLSASGELVLPPIRFSR